jgi:hypothetical protein
MTAAALFLVDAIVLLQGWLWWRHLPDIYARCLAAARRTPTPLFPCRGRVSGSPREGGRWRRLSKLGMPQAAAIVIGAMPFVTIVVSPLPANPLAAAHLGLASLAASMIALAGWSDRAHMILPPHLTLGAGLAAALAATLEFFFPGGAHVTPGDVVLAGFAAAIVELAARPERAEEFRFLGPGDAPMIFATLAWAGPIAGAFAIIGATLCLWCLASLGLARTARGDLGEARVPFGEALAWASLRMVIFLF